MNYTLSQQTADRLKKLLNTQDGSGNGVSGGSNRQDGFVLIDGDKGEDGYYPAVVVYFDAVDEGKVTYAAVKANPMNEDVALQEGVTYHGQRSGDTTDGDSIWLVADNLPPVCCGIRITTEDDKTGCDPGELVFDNDAVAGAGINAAEDSCQLYIDPGCGITLEGGKKIGVNAAGLQGDGLTAGPGCKLNVNAGKCLSIDDDGKLNVEIDGTFSAVTAVYFQGGCLVVTTTPFSFENCVLTAGDGFTQKYPIPCDGCQPCASSSSSMSSSSSPYLSSSSSTDCTDCLWSVTINGTSYQFEPFGGDGYIAAYEDGQYLYFTPNAFCTGFWQVSLYDGSLEQCRWESPTSWDGQGCQALEQRTNNGIPYTGCPASEVTLCCDGDGYSSSSAGSVYPSDTPCDPAVCGEQGWFMSGGVWVWDGSISCDCGTPTYPDFDSPEGIHTTTCCQPD